MAFMNAKNRNKTITLVLVGLISVGLLVSVSIGYVGTTFSGANTGTGTINAQSASVEDIATQDFQAAMNLAQQNKLDDAGKKFNSAINGYEEVLKTNPNNIQVLGDLATAYFYMGNTDKAIELAKKALAIQPKFSTVRINYARYLFYGKNNSAEALNELKQIDKNDVNYQGAQSLIAEINNSKSQPLKGSSLPSNGNNLPPQGNSLPPLSN